MSMRDRLQESVGKPHLSYSSLKYALGDMRLWEMYMRGQLKKESEALTFGTLYDMMLFEPEKASSTYVILEYVLHLPNLPLISFCMPLLLKETCESERDTESAQEPLPKPSGQIEQLFVRTHQVPEDV